MKIDVHKEIATLQRMSVGELHERYVQVCGEAVRSRHKTYLIRRIAWRLQAKAEGGLTERALRRAAELADEADVRVTPPKTDGASAALLPPPSRTVAVIGGDARIPGVGTAITRKYRGKMLSVTVLADGFEWNGERYRSLSAVAKAITGSHINGFRFFGLEGE